MADWGKVSQVIGSAKFIPQLETVVSGFDPLSGQSQPTLQVLHTSHWPQLERPKEFNSALRGWLQKLPAVGSVNYSSPGAEEAVGKKREEEHRHPADHAEGKIVDLDDKIREKAQSQETAHEEL